jgi:type II secretory pathway pseudopilin PulG
MNTVLHQRKELMKTSPLLHSRHQNAFTLTDLLILVATLAVLAMVVMPALAGVQNKGGRLECANNLRQIGAESMIYASENNGWLPVCNTGAANDNGVTVNHLGGTYYTRYVYIGYPSLPVVTNEPPSQQEGGEGYQNLGYLFHTGLAGNGNIFYCPAEWGDPIYGANAYSPLLTTDGSGIVESSYFYNPRVVNPAAGGTADIRKYQTVSQLEPHRLLAVDHIDQSNSEVAGISLSSIEHARDHGWNVLFTDGSVQFARLSPSNNSEYATITQDLIDEENQTSFLQYNTLFNWLEQDH